LPEPEPPGQTPQPEPAWRAGIDADRRKQPRPKGNQGQTLRQLTVYAVSAAIGLNIVLFFQVAAGGVGLGAIQSQIIAAIGGLMPGGGLRQSDQLPSPSAAPPVVTTGGS
jgi:hypothetical protein